MLAKSYKETLEYLKRKIYESQYRAMQSVNTELIRLYWEIGQIITEKQKKEKWGDSVVESLAQDLQAEFPGIKGFSKPNMWKMRQFFITYAENSNLSQLVREIPWGHNILIMNKCKEPLQGEFYIKMTIRYGWSRSTLEEKIEAAEYERWALKQDNYKQKLPTTLAKKAEFVNRDDYILDYLLLDEKHKERDLEKAITENIVKFLSTMGKDFAFIGRQFPIYIEGDEFFIDLLFYHRKIKSLLAIELKTGDFSPRDVGQMGLYLAALDKYEREEDENPSLGIIICKSKNREVVDLSLQFVARPIGVATYKTYKSKNALPDRMKKYLPTAEELKERLEVLVAE